MQKGDLKLIKLGLKKKSTVVQLISMVTFNPVSGKSQKKQPYDNFSVTQLTVIN